MGKSDVETARTVLPAGSILRALYHKL